MMFFPFPFLSSVFPFPSDGILLDIPVDLGTYSISQADTELVIFPRKIPGFWE